jgi:hypothetical protein
VHRCVVFLRRSHFDAKDAADILGVRDVAAVRLAFPRCAGVVFEYPTMRTQFVNVNLAMLPV